MRVLIEIKQFVNETIILNIKISIKQKLINNKH